MIHTALQIRPRVRVLALAPRKQLARLLGRQSQVEVQRPVAGLRQGHLGAVLGGVPLGPAAGGGAGQAQRERLGARLGGDFDRGQRRVRPEGGHGAHALWMEYHDKAV